MSDTDRELFEALPATQQMERRRELWMFLGRIGIPTYDEMLTILRWKELEVDVLDAHADWLHQARTTVEAQGRDWTLAECRNYDGWTTGDHQ